MKYRKKGYNRLIIGDLYSLGLDGIVHDMEIDMLEEQVIRDDDQKIAA